MGKPKLERILCEHCKGASSFQAWAVPVLTDGRKGSIVKILRVCDECVDKFQIVKPEERLGT